MHLALMKYKCLAIAICGSIITSQTKIEPINMTLPINFTTIHEETITAENIAAIGLDTLERSNEQTTLISDVNVQSRITHPQGKIVYYLGRHFLTFF